MGARLDHAKKVGAEGQQCLEAQSQWLLRCASDLSTRRQRNGHAMVTTGTEDKGSILESGPERLLILLRKAAGAQRSHWAMPEGVRGHMNACHLVGNSNGFVLNNLSSNN